MLATLKSEFRKLLSVRSTYVILIIALGLEVLFAFYATAFHAQQIASRDSFALAGEAADAISALNLFCAIVGVLLITHEYRYNTIVYTLTAAKSRTRVFFSKLAVISTFSILFALVFGTLAPLMAKLGFELAGNPLVPQEIHIWSLLWRVVFACWAFSMLAAIIALIIRVQVGALAAMFLLPTIVESILAALPHVNQGYLPFGSLSIVLNVHGTTMGMPAYTTAAITAAGWVVGGALVAWFLFWKRDAN